MMRSLKSRVTIAAKIANGLTSGLIYGNDIGLGNNREGARILRKARRTFKNNNASAETTSRAQELEETGILSLQNLYEPALIRSIVAKLTKMFDDPRHSKPRDLAIIHGLPEATRNIRDPLRVLPELSQLVNEKVISIIETYYGSHFRVVAAQVYRNSHVNPSSIAGREIYSDSWHFDRQHSAYVQMMVYLTDGVTRERGAYQTHDIPNSKKIMRRGYIYRNRIIGPARKMVQDTSRIRCFEGNAGDAMLTNNTLCLHRATIPGPGSMRDVIMLHFEPWTTPLSPNWAEELAPIPGDEGFLVRRDRAAQNVSDSRFHPAVQRYYTELEKLTSAGTDT